MLEATFSLTCKVLGSIPPDTAIFFELELLEARCIPKQLPAQHELQVSPPAEGLAWLWEQASSNPMPQRPQGTHEQPAGACSLSALCRQLGLP